MSIHGGIFFQSNHQIIYLFFSFGMVGHDVNHKWNRYEPARCNVTPDEEISLNSTYMQVDHLRV